MTQHTKENAPAAFIPDHRSEWEPSPRWVRVKFGGQYVADSTSVMLLRQTGRLPAYYFPEADVRMDVLEPMGEGASTPLCDTVRYRIRVGERQADDAAWAYTKPAPGAPDLKGYVAFEWDKMEGWFEEDDEVYVHPRDPYKRIDVLRSSRHVEVMLGGVTVADTRRPRLLFETDLPTRYYIPKQDVRMDLLVASDKHTRCPYKGVASYYSVKVGDKVYEDIAWYYPFPIPECPKIENMVCFYNEKVDAILVNGEEEPKPATIWS